MKNFEILKYYIKREPLLKLRNYINIPNSKEELYEFIDTLLNDTFFKEAIFISSPDLYYEWKKTVNRSEREKINTSILKFYIRAISNTVPFGLFSTYSTNIPINKPESYSRFSNVDMVFLCKIIKKINDIPSVKDIVRYRKNNTIYLSGNNYRYIESKNNYDTLTYTISSIEFNEVIELLLNRMQKELSFAELSEIIISNVDGVDKDVADQFISDLIQSNFFISSLESCINEEDCLDQILIFLRNHLTIVENSKELSTHYNILSKLHSDISNIDTNITNEISIYETIFTYLKGLDLNFDKKFVINSNLRKNQSKEVDSSLNEKIAKMIEATKLLSKQSEQQSPHNLEQFKARFYKRYEDAEVKFLEIFDNELGIGYLPDMNENALFLPLIEDIKISSSPPTYIYKKIVPEIYNFWLKLMLNKKDNLAIDLSKEDLSVFKNGVDRSLGTYGVIFNYADNKIYLKLIGAASALNVMGRFTNNDKEMQKIAEYVVDIENRIFENQITAEVLHLTNYRSGNLLIRKINRNHEITIIAKGSSNPENIELSDLLVSLKNNKFILRSRKYNKEVIPFISSTQNYHYDCLPHYQFLCDLQIQSRNNFEVINSGGLDFNDFEFVPRLTFGSDIILVKAKWNLNKEKLLAKFQNKKTIDLEMLKAVFRDLSVPQYVYLLEGDEEKMIIDINNINTISILLEELNKKGAITLTECVYNLNSESDFANEYIFMAKSNNVPSNNNPPLIKVNNIKENFVFGEKWIYLKLYTGFVTADEILSEQIADIIVALNREELIARWFFIRYTDPDFHIRFRIEAKHISNINRIIEVINVFLSTPIKENKIWRLEFGKYTRELDRYLMENIENSESIFHADSNLCLSIIQYLKNGKSEQNTWLYALKSIDDFFNSFEIELDKKLEVISIMFDHFWIEHGSDKNVKKTIDAKFRVLYYDIEKILNNNELPFFKQRHKNIGILNFENLDTSQICNLLYSYIHMTVNRLIKSKARLHELVIYGLLQKYYKKLIGISKYETIKKNEVC